MFLSVRWDYLWAVATNRPTVHPPDGIWVHSHGGMTGENWRTQRRTCPSVILSTNPTCTDPGTSLGLCSERPVTNHLSNGMAFHMMMVNSICCLVRFPHEQNISDKTVFSHGMNDNYSLPTAYSNSSTIRAGLAHFLLCSVFEMWYHCQLLVFVSLFDRHFSVKYVWGILCSCWDFCVWISLRNSVLLLFP
jgi:hypothetical protein